MKGGAAMRLMILGPQGVGKGTQATLLCEQLKVPHISTGDLFRNHVTAKTALGQRAYRYMSVGELVPDDVTNAMVDERLAAPDAATGYLLDGFPRTPDQAGWLTGTLRAGQELQAVIVLEAPEQELIDRLLLRGRGDDTPEVIRRRLAIYRSTTASLLGYYADLVVPVDGTGTVEDVHARIVADLTDRLTPIPGLPAESAPAAPSAGLPTAGGFA
jgi:adenylate kinase